MITLFGATGDLGGRIAQRLHDRGSRFRAFVRPSADASGVRALTNDVSEGTFLDPTSLAAAVDGASVAISTVTAIGRMLAGEKGADLRRVDQVGHLQLIEAAERAGVEQFVFVSAAGFRQRPGASSPLGAAKVAVEDRLIASPMREVIVRPDMFQEVWLAPITRFDWPARKVVIFGKGECPARYVSTDDVAEAVVRLALEPDPPRALDFGGPQALTRKQAINAFERAIGVSFRVRHVPRPALHAGRLALRRIRPAIASLMAISLNADLHPAAWDDGPLRRLGIEPRSVDDYVAEIVKP